ncbi:glutathione S-transferase A4 isoform X1 [Cavia porcellus]|uniref:glutathione S-transferase A4 isoform X1 n=1 Tax=Cavia porcellus TaxID=10141 RepID=UPI000661C602|nr:glutathione S-transferase A4 isoform X1 [Cavia porcellus]
MLKFKLKEVKSGPILHYPECLAAGWGMLSAAVTIGDARATRQPDPPPPRRRQCSLQACRVQFDEEFLETKEQLQKLQDGEHLLFQQVPMVEIDGMKLVQTRSILHYIAEKHQLFGKDLKERTLIDMYVEGTLDLLEMLIMHPFLKPEDQPKEVVHMAQKAIIRYFPVFEKVLRGHGQNFLVGNQLSLADVILLQTILALEEKIPNILSTFPFLQEYTVKLSNIPTIKRFLEPGSKKKPPPDDVYVRTVYNIFMS